MANAENEYLIKTYQGDDKIIADFYRLKGDHANAPIEGIVNPLKIDNRQLMAPVDNQFDFKACAGFSAATLIESIYWKHTGKLIQLDSLQVYAKAKLIDGMRNADGTYLEAAMNAVLTLCKGKDEFKFLNDAKIGVVYNDRTQRTIDTLKFTLHKYDFIQAGFSIDEGWTICKNDSFVLREYGEALGGHAVNICGYDEHGFYVLNQWGTDFGAKGFAIIPYDLFMKQFMYMIYLYNFKY